jgi:hypothetical protein
MNTQSLRHPAIRFAACALAIGLSAALPSGCVATGGYGYDDGGSVGVGYYEPYGADYGGWGSGYRVGPYRGGGGDRGGGDRGGGDRGGGDRGGGHDSGHAYRAAPASRSMPSIPSHSRGGGSRGH